MIEQLKRLINTLVKMNINKLLIKYRTLLLYGIIGSFCAGLDFIIFYALTSYLHLFYLIANMLSVIIGISFSFILNRNINFRVKDNTVKRYSIFFAVGISGLLLSSLLLTALIELMKFNGIIAKLCSIVIVVILQYIANKNITFRRPYEA